MTPEQMLTPQPPPRRAAGTEAHRDVVTDILEEHHPAPTLRDLLVYRRTQGMTKYGMPLWFYDGRNAGADVGQELVDTVCYGHRAARVARSWRARMFGWVAALVAGLLLRVLASMDYAEFEDGTR
jgi:hypothetical protein